MPVPEDELDHRVETFSQALRGQGLRLTRQRLEVVREIASTDEHPDVETVYRGVRQRVPTISLDTVYRTLATLARIGLISRVTATPGVARYDADSSPHHHFVCMRCGLVRDAMCPDLDAVGATEWTSVFGTVESVEVQLRGVCSQCAGRDSS